MAKYVDAVAMFFAGLILLIPHRIGMSRVNYVIKRYNLPISRAGLLLYKYHNNIELSLLCGTFPMVVIICSIAAIDSGNPDNKKDPVRICMTIFLFLMLLSSIIMFILYVSGGDFGHLNAFYFSLILLTFFDGFANACAFAINAKYSSLLSAGIPLSGALVTLLHYVYKFFYDSYHLDDFDYYVLRLQLICNILTIFICLLLWIWDLTNNYSAPGKLSTGDPTNLFNSANEDKNHTLDWSPIGMLAISLGTVYAFYPSIAPYSIIDFQYASVIELSILIISAIIPFVIAGLDLATVLYFDLQPTAAKKLDYAFGPSGLYVVALHNNFGSGNITVGGKTYSWTAGKSGTSCTKYDNGGKPPPLTAIKYNWSYTDTTKDNKYRFCWQLVWLCVIPYILFIQIFMSLLHYPDCLLSCFFKNHPFRIQVISVLFNTLRELMQAFGFAGAGKQVKKQFEKSSSNLADATISCARTGSTGHDTDCIE